MEIKIKTHYLEIRLQISSTVKIINVIPNGENDEVDRSAKLGEVTAIKNIRKFINFN